MIDTINSNRLGNGVEGTVTDFGHSCSSTIIRVRKNATTNNLYI